VGFYPFRGPGASSTLTSILAEGARPETYLLKPDFALARVWMHFYQ
jgi:hypothetical protein